MNGVQHTKALRLPIGSATVFPMGNGQQMAIEVTDVGPAGNGEFFADVLVHWTEAAPEPPKRDLTPFYARSVN